MNRLVKLFIAVVTLCSPAVPAAGQQGYGTGIAAGDGFVYVSQPENGVRPGTIFAYRSDESGSWLEAGRISAPDARPDDRFGAAVAADGTLLLASGIEPDDGALVFFTFDADADGSWRPGARFTAEDGPLSDSAGVSLTLDGDVAVAGVPGAADGAGAVYIFRRGAEGAWTQASRLTGSDAQPGDRFGAAVALGSDRLLVGAPGQAENRGAAYIFTADSAGDWNEQGKMVARTVSEGSLLGASVAILGERAVVAAPGRDENSGAVYIFERDPTSGDWAAFTRLFPFDGDPQSRFGAALALSDQELWVGAPGADGFAGTIYRMRWDEELQDWRLASKLSPAAPEGGASFGAALTVVGNVGVSSVPGDDFGAGSAVILTRSAGGEWAVADEVWSEVPGFEATTGGRIECGEGTAGSFECAGVDLMAFLPLADIGGDRGVQLNDIWGWTDPESGREYALVGRTNGTSFVDVTDPERPAYLGDLPMTAGARANAWRDIKVYRDHAFIVADGAGPHGMQVFDLTQLRDVADPPITFQPTALYDRIASAHNIVINEAAGVAFSVGSNSGGESCGGGLHMIDIRDPRNPRFAGCFADTETGNARTGYTHDAQCVTYSGPDEQHRGREICFGSNETALSIADVTDRERPVALSRASYPNVQYSHQGWLTEDQRYFYMDDEGDELAGVVPRTRTIIWDVADLDDPQVVGEFLGTTEASDHNLYIVGDTMYQSNYAAGLRVVDISDRMNPREIGFFDTAPGGSNEPGFSGSWSNYPYFGSGVIVVTSMGEGLFVLKPRKPTS